MASHVSVSECSVGLATSKAATFAVLMNRALHLDMLTLASLALSEARLWDSN
jgi:hypothetical protein